MDTNGQNATSNTRNIRNDTKRVVSMQPHGVSPFASSRSLSSHDEDSSSENLMASSCCLLTHARVEVRPANDRPCHEYSSFAPPSPYPVPVWCGGVRCVASCLACLEAAATAKHKEKRKKRHDQHTHTHTILFLAYEEGSVDTEAKEEDHCMNFEKTKIHHH